MEKSTLFLLILLQFMSVNLRSETLENLSIYGVSSPALHSVTEAIDYIEETSLMDEADSELYRYLFFDALNHYSAYLVGMRSKPSLQYFTQFEPLFQMKPALRDTGKQAFNDSAKAATQLRFNISLVKLSVKHVHNGTGNKQSEQNILINRLNQITQQLKEDYPFSKGELPPFLVAFAQSAFEASDNPAEEVQDIPISCENPLPKSMQSNLLSKLSPTPQRQN